MNLVPIPIKFAGSVLREYRHVCAFFGSPDEEYRVLLPFIREGLERGEHAFHIVDPALREHHLTRLRTNGIDVESAQRNGQLEVRVTGDTYLRNGHFDKDAMLALIQDVLMAGLVNGYPLTRLVAHAEGVLHDEWGARDWIEYEARLNYVLPRFDDAVICTYDLSLVSASVALDVMRTHPLVILAGVLHQNPFYSPPGEMLQELRERATLNSMQQS